MKVTAKVSISGLELKFKYIREGARQGLSNTVFEAARLIEEEAKLLAPVRTGALRDSITTEMETEEPTRAVAVIHPTVDYAKFVEFGTRHMQAIPFMRPAFEMKKLAALEYIDQNIRKAIAEEIQNGR